MYYIEFLIENRFDYDKCSIRYVATTASITNPSPRASLTFTTSIIEYKTLLRKCMRIVSLAKAARKMYDSIESNPDISRAYDFADFAFELNALEKQFCELNEFVDFLPFYDNLQKRIESYSAANKGKISATDQKVLALLYTTILSKTVSIRSGQNFDLIIDIENFLDLIIQNIKEFDETTRIGLVKAHRDKYISVLEERIDEANAFITQDIQPKIGQVFSALDIEMQNVIDETITLQKITKKEIETKQKNAKIIRRIAMFRRLTDILDVMVVSVLGAYGKMAGSAISAVSGITNGLSEDTKIDSLEIPTEVKIIQNALDDQLMVNFRNKIDAFECELNKIANLTENVNAGEFDEKFSVLTTSVEVAESYNSYKKLLML